MVDSNMGVPGWIGGVGFDFLKKRNYTKIMVKFPYVESVSLYCMLLMSPVTIIRLIFFILFFFFDSKDQRNSETLNSLLKNIFQKSIIQTCFCVNMWTTRFGYFSFGWAPLLPLNFGYNKGFGYAVKQIVVAYNFLLFEDYKKKCFLNVSFTPLSDNKFIVCLKNKKEDLEDGLFSLVGTSLTQKDY